jgi:hypothetical protein
VDAWPLAQLEWPFPSESHVARVTLSSISGSPDGASVQFLCDAVSELVGQKVLADPEVKDTKLVFYFRDVSWHDAVLAIAFLSGTRVVKKGEVYVLARPERSAFTATEEDPGSFFREIGELASRSVVFAPELIPVKVSVSVHPCYAMDLARAAALAYGYDLVEDGSVLTIKQRESVALFTVWDGQDADETRFFLRQDPFTWKVNANEHTIEGDGSHLGADDQSSIWLGDESWDDLTLELKVRIDDGGLDLRLRCQEKEGDAGGAPPDSAWDEIRLLSPPPIFGQWMTVRLWLKGDQAFWQCDQDDVEMLQLTHPKGRLALSLLPRAKVALKDVKLTLKGAGTHVLPEHESWIAPRNVEKEKK